MNLLEAKLVSVLSTEHTSLLSVETGFEHLFWVLLAEKCTYASGDALKLVFKESEVILAKSAAMTSANLQSGTVSSVERGEILTQVTLSHPAAEVVAIVATVAFDRLEIAVGDVVYWMIQPSEISLMGENRGS